MYYEFIFLVTVLNFYEKIIILQIEKSYYTAFYNSIIYLKKTNFQY